MLSGHAMVIEHSKDKSAQSDIDLDMKPNEEQISSLKTSRSDQPPQLISTPLLRDTNTPHPSVPRDKETLAKEEALKKTKEYLHLFHKELGSRTPENEKLLGDFSCAYQKDKLFVHGRMYISENYLCFYSTIFGETKKVIKLYRIKKLFKRNTAILFPNAIELWTDKKKYFFTSFIFRDQAYVALSEASERAKSRTPPDHTSSNETSDPLGSDVDEALEEFPEDSEDESTNKRTEEASSPEDTLSSSPNHSNVLSSSPNANSNLARPTFLVNANVATQASADVVDNISVNNPPNVTLPPTRNALCSHYDAIEKRDFYISEFIPVSPMKYFIDLYSDSSDFLHEHHKRESLKETSISQWSLSENGCCLQRTVSFISPVKARIGPKSAFVYQIQKCCFLSPSHLIIETVSETKDVPYGDTFFVMNHFDISQDAARNGSILKISSYVKFIKTVWGLKGMIEKGCIDGAKEYAVNLVTFLKERLSASPSSPSVPLISSSVSIQPNSPDISVESKDKSESLPIPAQVSSNSLPPPSNSHAPLSVNNFAPSFLNKSQPEKEFLQMVWKELSKLSLALGIILFLVILLLFFYFQNSRLQSQLDETSLQTQIFTKIQQIKFLLESEIISKQEYLELLEKLKESPEFSRFREKLFNF